MADQFAIKLPADEELVFALLGRLRNMEAVSREREVVGDFSAFGLAQPTAQYTLLQRGGTNAILGQISFGAPAGETSEELLPGVLMRIPFTAFGPWNVNCYRPIPTTPPTALLGFSRQSRYQDHPHSGRAVTGIVAQSRWGMDSDRPVADG